MSNYGKGVIERKRVIVILVCRKEDCKSIIVLFGSHTIKGKYSKKGIWGKMNQERGCNNFVSVWMRNSLSYCLVHSMKRKRETILGFNYSIHPHPHHSPLHSIFNGFDSLSSFSNNNFTKFDSLLSLSALWWVPWFVGGDFPRDGGRSWDMCSHALIAWKFHIVQNTSLSLLGARRMGRVGSCGLFMKVKVSGTRYLVEGWVMSGL